MNSKRKTDIKTSLILIAAMLLGLVWTSCASDLKEAEQTPADVTVNIYHTDDEYLNLISSQETISELTPENLMEQLYTFDLAPSNVTVNKFVNTTENGETILNLDLSEDYQKMLQNQGTTGEYFMIASLVNTFLEAYNADKIQITVNGSSFSGSHEDVNRYYSFFN